MIHGVVTPPSVPGSVTVDCARRLATDFASKSGNKIVGFVIDYNGTKIVNVVIGFGLE